MLITMLLTGLLSVGATSTKPQDVYYAYFVRTRVTRLSHHTLTIQHGPMTFAEGLSLAKEIKRDGVCVVDIQPTLNNPGHATCYPVHLITKVEVVSPQ